VPWVNFLVLAIVHHGVAYPILWTLLPHKGNGGLAERLPLPRFNLRQGRRAKSLFRHGLDYLCHLLAPSAATDPVCQDHFCQLLQLLSCAESRPYQNG
jgi:hypothetical protein